MCDCLSYNGQGRIGGTTPEVALSQHRYFPDAPRDIICVDACIAEVIERLWAAGVRTEGCCCGHNRTSMISNGYPEVMLSGPEHAEAAFRVLADDPREWWVTFWAGGPVAQTEETANG